MPAIYNYTTPTIGKIRRVLDFLNNNQFFFAIGQTLPWDSTFGYGVNDSSPPTPVIGDYNIPGIALLKRPQIITPCVESQCGDLTFTSCGNITTGGVEYSLINLDKTDRTTLYTLAPSHLYFSLSLTSSDISTPFRALGLYTNVVLKSGVASNLITYLPNQLYSYGVLHWESYFTPTSTTTNSNVLFEVVLSF